jgi:DNA-binding response OmpR family regulator
MKFTPADGEVTVSLTALPGDIMELVVMDNGLGIGAYEQHKIFERFYQVDNTPVRSHGGTGIGLALVKELITTMNGQVAVQSQIGGPTSFIIQIPVEKMASDYLRPILHVTEAQPVSFHTNGRGAVPIVLVVEDNAELRGFLVESMSLAYKCLQAGDGAAAWEIILQELPDIVISDVMMPEMDGYGLCHRCKTDNRTAHIGFILLTSKAATEAKLKGLKTGADDYITKPFNLQELDLRTANLLQLQQNVRVQLQEMVLPSAPVEIVAPVSHPFLQQLYAEIDVKINDANLGVDHLSKTMNMSRSTLNRKLQALLGTSPNELIRQYRLQKATEHMAAGADVSTAAYKTGFSSPSYFTQCFKEHYQITPTEWMASRNARSSTV